jgi:hypothetical protein
MHLYFVTLFYILGLAVVNSRADDHEPSNILPFDVQDQEKGDGAVLRERHTIIRRLETGFSNNVGASFDQKLMGVPLKFWLIIASIVFITAACSCNWMCCCNCFRRGHKEASSSGDAKKEAADATKIKQKIVSKSKTAPLQMNILPGLPTIQEESEDETGSKNWSSPV